MEYYKQIEELVDILNRRTDDGVYNKYKYTLERVEQVDIDLTQNVWESLVIKCNGIVLLESSSFYKHPFSDYNQYYTKEAMSHQLINQILRLGTESLATTINKIKPREVTK